MGSDISLLGGCSKGGELLDEPVGHLLDFINVPVGQLGGIPCMKVSSLDVTRDTDSQLGRTSGVESLRRDLDSLSQSIDIILLVLLDILQELGVGSGHIVE